MKIRIQMVIEHDDDGGEPEIEEMMCFSRDTNHLTIEQLGLSLDEAKDILAKTQTTLIAHQTEAFVGRHHSCQEYDAASQKTEATPMMSQHPLWNGLHV